LTGSQIGLRTFLTATGSQSQNRGRDQDEPVKTHDIPSRIRCDCRCLYAALLARASFRETEPTLRSKKPV